MRGGCGSGGGCCCLALPLSDLCPSSGSDGARASTLPSLADAIRASGGPLGVSDLLPCSAEPHRGGMGVGWVLLSRRLKPLFPPSPGSLRASPAAWGKGCLGRILPEEEPLSPCPGTSLIPNPHLLCAKGTVERLCLLRLRGKCSLVIFLALGIINYLGF